MKRYRLSLDDNIWVFRDLAAGRPSSLFENPYLGFLHTLHNRYQTKIQLNIYWETEGFSLAEMPKLWKDEWQENSDWLRLSFHGRTDAPPSPYQNAGYAEVFEDCQAVHREILRFAGRETLSLFTTIHYTDVSKEGVRALRDCGIKGLVGLFGERGNARSAYSLSEELSRKIRSCDGYFDRSTGLFYFCNDLVLNNVTVSQLPALLEARREQAFLELMIHEQYFHSRYPAHQPDYREKVETAVRWAAEQGYQPCFLEELAE